MDRCLTLATAALLTSLAGLSVAASPAPDRPGVPAASARPAPARTAASSPEAQDADNPPYIAAAMKIGTLGPGLEATVGIAEWINLRAGGHYVRVKHSGSVKDVEYDVDVKLASVPLLLDIHPFRNEFRITGGALYNRNMGDLDSRPNKEVTIGDHKYPPELIGELSGAVRFRNWAPYVGLGYGNAVLDADKTWGFVFDLGIMIQGSPEVDLEASGPLADNPVFRADLQKERDEIQDDADVFRIYPVLAFGISYQF